MLWAVKIRLPSFEFSTRVKELITILAVAFVLVIGPTLARAQGCAMCSRTAAAAKASGIQALRSGILILLFPPLLIFIGIFAVAYKRRNRFIEPDPSEPDVDRELRTLLSRMRKREMEALSNQDYTGCSREVPPDPHR